MNSCSIIVVTVALIILLNLNKISLTQDCKVSNILEVILKVIKLETLVFLLSQKKELFIFKCC